MANDDPLKWRSWLTPAVVLTGVAIIVGIATTVLTVHLGGISDRIAAIEGREGTTGSSIAATDAKIDRRADAIEARIGQVTERIDRVLESQAERAQQVAQVQTDVDYIKGRIDRIADKLEVAAGPSDWAPSIASVKGQTAQSLRAAGYKLFDIENLDPTPSQRHSGLRRVLAAS